MSIRLLVRVAFGLAGLSMASVPAEAVPRYAAQYGQRCALCHIDPSGGGQRTAYAVQSLVPQELCSGLLSEAEIVALDPALGPNVTAGADLRTIYHRSNPERPGIDNFMQMQGAVHLNFQLSPRVSAYVSRGQSETSELFGLGYLLPLDGHVKIGRFTPAYGWRFADHTQYTREVLGWVSPGRSDVGLECALNPGRWSFTGSITNGNRGSIGDDNEQAAYAGQAFFRANVQRVGVGLGASVWRNSSASGRRFDRGPYAYLTIGPLTWLGESDWSTRRGGPTGGERTGWVVSQEATMRLRRGLELRATYDFRDPDIDLETGTRRRVGAGFEFFPAPYVAVHTMIRHEESTDGAAGAAPAAEIDAPEVGWFECQVHLLF